MRWNVLMWCGACTLLVLSLMGCRNGPNGEEEPVATSEPRVVRQFGSDEDNDVDYREALKERVRRQEELLPYERAVEMARVEVRFAEREVSYARERLDIAEQDQKEPGWFPSGAERQLNKARRKLEKAESRLSRAEEKLKKAKSRLDEDYD